MFKKLFGQGGRQAWRDEAVVALQLLDKAILSIHPERYVIEEDAALDIQPLLVSINTFLGRPETERFYPIDYEAVVQRLGFYRSRNVLEPILEADRPLPVMHALMKGTLHEYKLREHKHPHDATNLGKEVQSSTLSLIGFLNRCAKARPEPMPGKR